MIGLDTNILVRYIMQDDPLQSPKATRIIEHHIESQKVYISLASILELVWVLESFYSLTDRQVALAVQRILQIETVVVQNEDEVSAAVLALKAGWGSFEDALIGAIGSWADCDATLTFDKKASRLPGFQLIA